MNALQLENIKMQFNQKVLFENLDLTIEKGTINTIMGESGSGKSTLLNIIGLLLKPTTGTINILDHQNVKSNTRQAMLILRNDISYIFQNYALIDDETVYQNIELGLKYTKENHQEKIESILKKLHLEDLKEEKISFLSGWEQQRVAFARAFVKPSEIILCDEPTGNLDLKNKKIILDLLKQLNEDGKTIIIVTHDKDVESIAHHKYHLDNKTVIEKWKNRYANVPVFGIKILYN